MHKIEKNVYLVEYLPKDIDSKLHDIVTALYVYWIEHNSQLPSKELYLFVPAILLPYVYSIDKKRLLRKSNADIWKEGYNITTIPIREIEGKIVLMERF